MLVLLIATKFLLDRLELSLKNTEISGTFSELADFIDDELDDSVIEVWQSTLWHDWAMESQSLLNQAYDLPVNGSLSYEYMFKNYDTVQLRLLQAGVRMAGVINDIYGN